MIGMAGAQAAIVARLRAALPANLTAARARYGCTAADLPLPEVFPFQRKLDVNGFPVIWVVELIGESTQNGVTDAGPLLTSRYTMALMCWVRQVDWESTGTNRARLALAVREVLSLRPLLLEAGSESIAVDVASITEDYSSPDDSSRQVIAGVAVQLTVNVSELLLDAAAPPAGEPAVVAATVVLLPPLPTSNPAVD